MTDSDKTQRLIGPLRIEALANGGSGISRHDGRVIFVAGAFPGDLVLGRLLKEKKNYAQAEVVELQQPSPLRRVPPCPVAEQCGGCQWQQLPYAEQLRWKQQLFSDTLVRQAGIDASLIRPIVPSPDEFGYRSRVQIKCHLAAGRFLTGFFRPRSHFVVDIESCPLMTAEMNRALVALRDAIASSPYAARIPQIDLEAGADGMVRAVIHFLGGDDEGLRTLLLSVADSLGFDLAIQSGRKKSLQLLRGTGELAVVVDEPTLELKYAAGGFAQINLAQNQALVRAVMEAADLSGNEQILDLYCGMGNFSLPFAARASFVTGIEDFFPSIAMARRNAAANNLDNVAFHAMPAEQVFDFYENRADLLFLDPPRAGAYAVVKQVLKRPVLKIIYVSCDPQTLARDLVPLINGGYRVLFSQPFDMFPQTFHIESLTCLEYSLESV